jgi:hypothetical protein
MFLVIWSLPCFLVLPILLLKPLFIFDSGSPTVRTCDFRSILYLKCTSTVPVFLCEQYLLDTQVSIIAVILVWGKRKKSRIPMLPLFKTLYFVDHDSFSSFIQMPTPKCCIPSPKLFYADFFFFFFFFGGTVVWPPGFVLSMQALYNFSPTSSTICSGYFFGDGNLKNYLPWLVSNHNPPISASQVARITGVSHWCLANVAF